MATEKRLIDANALKKRLDSLEASGGHKYYRKGMDDVLHFHMPNIINEAPTVDAVEVVRCKDCQQMLQKGWCSLHNTPMAQEDFCSYGERRTEDG
jgi:hypothetical protein